MEEDKLYCPSCGSSQLTANKKGFGTGKAVTGAILTGGIGLLAGFIGSGDIKVTCIKCGRKWNPGELRTTPMSEEEIQQEKEREEKAYERSAGCAQTFIIVGILAMVLMVLYASTLG